MKPMPSKETLFEEIPSPGYLSHNVSRGDKMVTESWAHNEEDLTIEGFDRLFKNKEENMCHSNLPSSKRNMHPREVQKSKRLEKQQLMGRFAESDG